MNSPTADKIREDMDRLLDDLKKYADAHPDRSVKVLSARAGMMTGIGLVNNALR